MFRRYPVDGSIIRLDIWRYALAVLIVIAGFGLFAYYIFNSVSGAGGDLVQVVVPGGADLDLKETGEYTVFYESRSFADGKFFNTGEQINGLQINVVQKATGRELAVYPPSGSFRYSLGSRIGQSIMAFQVDRPGVYRIEASYVSGSGPEVVLAVGSGFAWKIFSLVLSSLAIAFGSIAFAAIIAITTYRGRIKAIARQKEEERIIRGLH
ncbi:MAG: hypothetical protein EHM14_08035 [Methanothrix sp.]|nr:MAG: hypothetical protein EHM14_08035 [Methanothrix sp.]